MLDTHAVLWLHDGLTEKFSAAGSAALERSRLILPGAAELELAFLKEIGRIRRSPADVIGALFSDIGLERSGVPLAAVIEETGQLTWTRDPFDRLICAEVAAVDARLLTRDRKILDAFERAFW